VIQLPLTAKMAIPVTGSSGRLQRRRKFASPVNLTASQTTTFRSLAQRRPRNQPRLRRKGSISLHSPCVAGPALSPLLLPKAAAAARKELPVTNKVTNPHSLYLGTE